jgi:hypothetical protein
MVKDIYAIYESYLAKEGDASASISNSEGGFRGTSQSFRPLSQGSTPGDLGENEESKAVINLAQSILNAAKTGDLHKAVFDYKKLGDFLSKKGYKL